MGAYRWWSVFWVLFTAKNGNGNGHEDAQIYVEVRRPSSPSRAPYSSLSVAATQHQRSRARIATGQPQPPAARYINGGMPPRQPGALPPNMPMPNGVGTPAPPGGQPSMPNGVTGPAPFHMHPQPNGAPAPPGGPSPQQQPGQQFPPHMLAMGQRPGPPQQQQPGQQQPGQQQPGQPGQQRGMPNYQSPTMAPSPQGTHPGQPGQGPSPQMQHMVRGGMPPPQGMQVGGPGGPMQQPPTPSFQPMGARPPSRPVTPAKPMMLPSPSMQNRLIGQPADMRQMHAGATVEAEYSRLQPAHVQQLKQELGIDRDMPSLTFDDKVRPADRPAQAECVLTWPAEQDRDAISPAADQGSHEAGHALTAKRGGWAIGDAARSDAASEPTITATTTANGATDQTQQHVTGR